MAEKQKAVLNKKPKEKRYDLDMLGEHCGKLFGVTSAVFAGATNGLKPGKYTIEEIKARINSWSKEVLR